MNFPTGVKIAALELLSHVRRPIRYCAYRLRNHVSPLFLLPELIATTNHAQLTSCFLFQDVECRRIMGPSHQAGDVEGTVREMCGEEYPVANQRLAGVR